jgi:hypothetical protein
LQLIPLSFLWEAWFIWMQSTLMKVSPEYSDLLLLKIQGVPSKALNVAIFFGALEVLLEKMQVTWQVRGAIIFYRQSKFNWSRK